MKKIILPISFIIFSVNMVFAQTESVLKNDIKTEKKEKKADKKIKKEDRDELRLIKGEKVSSESRQQFLNDFGNAGIINDKHSSYYDEFSFMKNGVLTQAYYDADAKLLGITQLKALADLPAKARNEINKKYKNYKIMEVVFFDDNELNDSNMWLYNTQFDDEDTYFVKLQKPGKKIIVQVDLSGDVRYFTSLK